MNLCFLSYAMLCHGIQPHATGSPTHICLYIDYSASSGILICALRHSTAPIPNPSCIHLPYGMLCYALPWLQYTRSILRAWYCHLHLPWGLSTVHSLQVLVSCIVHHSGAPILTPLRMHRSSIELLYYPFHCCRSVSHTRG